MRFSTVYNASILTGLGLIASGVYLAAGVAASLIVTGALVLALTIFAALVLAHGAKGR